MNIIYFGKYTLNNFYASAGAKRVINQIKYLEKENKVQVITLSKYKSTYTYNTNLRRFDSKLLQILILPFYWFFICFLLILKRRKGKNIILLESVVELNFLIPLLFSKLLGYKVVHDVVENFFISQENTSKFQRGNSFLSGFFNRITPIYTDGIIVISDKLQKLYIHFNTPIIRIYNAVEDRINIDNYPKENKEFTFLYSGTFGIKDGVKDLILAFNNISTDYSNVKLVLTGINKSNYFNECMDLIKENDKICYLGFLSEIDLQKEYQSADVFMVTRDESLFADYGFPYKLSEYLTYKKPVISSSVSDIPILFSDYIDILLTKPSNIESITEKMRFSIEHKNELRQLAESGYNKGKEYFSIAKNGDSLYKFLLQI